MALTRILITDVTRMQRGHVCVAGIQRGGRNVRPVLPYSHIPEEWLYQDGETVIRPFADVELDLQKPDPHNPHSEDWVVDPENRIYHGLLEERIRRDQLNRYMDPSVGSIFGAEIHSDFGWYVREHEGERSLGMVIPKAISEVTYRQQEETFDYRIHFVDSTDTPYSLKVTDLSFRYYLDFRHKNEGIGCQQLSRELTALFQHVDVILRIGLTRPNWEIHPHCCALQIISVYTFPDYLEGRCFSDFQQPEF